MAITTPKKKQPYSYIAEHEKQKGLANLAKQTTMKTTTPKWSEVTFNGTPVTALASKKATTQQNATNPAANQFNTQQAILQGAINGIKMASPSQTTKKPSASGYGSSTYKGKIPSYATPTDNSLYLNSLAQNMPQSLSEYTSKYTNQINALVDKITNREAFSYDLNADPLYEMYKNQYTQLGDSAMKDTIAEASALTGGYGNSYATTAGNQAYQSYLNQINAVVPELYESAYGKYQDEGNDLLQKLAMYQELDSGDYAKYLDAYDMEIQRQQMARDQLESDRNYNLALEEFNRKNYESDRDYNTALQELAQSQKSSGSSARAEVVNDYYDKMKALLDAEDVENENKYRYTKKKVADTILQGYNDGIISENEASELFFSLGIDPDEFEQEQSSSAQPYSYIAEHEKSKGLENLAKQTAEKEKVNLYEMLGLPIASDNSKKIKGGSRSGKF